MDQDMAYRRDQRREGHDKGAGSDSSFQFHTKERRENDQHHHASACTDKARTKSDRQSEEE